MKPERGPQTMFFGNYCSGIPGLANYEMPSEVSEGNFLGTPVGRVARGKSHEARAKSQEAGAKRAAELQITINLCPSLRSFSF